MFGSDFFYIIRLVFLIAKALLMAKPPADGMDDPTEKP